MGVEIELRAAGGRRGHERGSKVLLGGGELECQIEDLEGGSKVIVAVQCSL